MKKPNVLFVFGDQWRKQALGYEGDPNVKTPHLDAFARDSINMTNAISGTPVCTPYRASLLTGQRPLTHGLFLNDAKLSPDITSIADAFSEEGYKTAYVGKWHVDGYGRSGHIPKERRQGFEYWKVLECTHNYNQSPYYNQDETEKSIWEGYDAYAQTLDVQNYIKHREVDSPFLAMLSWGPPHNPYETAPQKYQDMYSADEIELRENVPSDKQDVAKKELAGYYAHCSALDDCFGMLIETLKSEGIYDDTIIVFSSDHGDMLHSQGERRKQRPWAESARIPFLIRLPSSFDVETRSVDGFIDAPDVMPTLLDLCGISIPEGVEGRSFAEHLRGGEDPSGGQGLIALYQPFGEYTREEGGREYRALLTSEFTYCKSLDGPWLMYHDEKDPFQIHNIIGEAEYAEEELRLEERLQQELEKFNDDFQPGMVYVDRWNYTVNKSGTISYTN